MSFVWRKKKQQQFMRIFRRMQAPEILLTMRIYAHICAWSPNTTFDASSHSKNCALIYEYPHFSANPPPPLPSLLTSIGVRTDTQTFFLSLKSIGLHLSIHKILRVNILTGLIVIKLPSERSFVLNFPLLLCKITKSNNEMH